MGVGEISIACIFLFFQHVDVPTTIFERSLGTDVKSYILGYIYVESQKVYLLFVFLHYLSVRNCMTDCPASHYLFFFQARGVRTQEEKCKPFASFTHHKYQTC
jgi:hypothetical protein